MGRSAFLIVLGATGLAAAPLLAQSTKPFPPGETRAADRSATPPGAAAAERFSGKSADTNRLSDSRPITPTGRRLSTAGGKRRETTSGGTSLWRTFGALAVVLGLIVVGARLWKKHGPRIAAGLPAEAMEVLGKRHLDSRQLIWLVRIGSRILVLGSTATGLQTLAEVTDPVEVDYLAGLCRRDNQTGGVAQTFQALFSRHGDKEDVDAGSPFSRQRMAEREFPLRPSEVGGSETSQGFSDVPEVLSPASAHKGTHV